VTAVAIAPLSLVQAFAAGGLALSVPLAAGAFGHRISRAQVITVLLMAAALASLPIGVSGSRDHLHEGTFVACIVAVGAVALAAGLVPEAPLRATAAGLCYGAADAAIKAISIRWGGAGAAALFSGWTIVALLGTFAGFVSFQAALRAGGAVSSISLMNGFATLVALACGFVSFGESFGGGNAILAVHLLAVALVLACVPALAAAQAEIADQPDGSGGSVRGERRADRAARERAANGEQDRLQPRAETRVPGPQDIGQAQVAGQRERSLRGEQQQKNSERHRQSGAPETRQADQREARDGTRWEPRDDESKQGLPVESGQLQERQGIVHRRTDREPVQTA
jgi:hypothetical protein